MNEQLVDNLKGVLHEAEDLLESTAGASGEALKAARRAFSEAAEAIRDELRRLPRQVGNAARASGRVAREHPYETAGGGLLLVAVVIGVVWLWQRSR